MQIFYSYYCHYFVFQTLLIRQTLFFKILFYSEKDSNLLLDSHIYFFAGEKFILVANFYTCILYLFSDF